VIVSGSWGKEVAVVESKSSGGDSKQGHVRHFPAMTDDSSDSKIRNTDSPSS
jgi:hypothetical protein